MLYLSRLRLNARNRDVRRDLADCQHLHRTILSAFPQVPSGVRPRAHFKVLYRLEGGEAAGPEVLVQSVEEPTWTVLPSGYLTRPPDCKDVDHAYTSLQEGTVLRFRLRANPTRRVTHQVDAAGKSWEGKRIDLRREPDQLAWLERKGTQGGFEVRDAQIASGVPDVRVTPHSKLTGRGGHDRRLSFGAVVFDGTLRITDVSAFRHTLEQGIGSGKAYGFGLLSIAPVRSI